MQIRWLTILVGALFFVTSSAFTQMRGPTVIAAQDELPDDETPGVRI